MAQGTERPGAGTTRWRPSDDDLECLRLLAEGRTTFQVARSLGTSERTVRRRLRTLADGLDVGTTIEVVVRAVRDDLI